MDEIKIPEIEFRAPYSQIPFECLKFANIKKSKFSDVQEFLDLDIVNSSVWLAGGSLQTLVDPAEIFDYDLFFKSSEDAKQTRKKLEKLQFEKTFECPQGELFTFYNLKLDIKVQLITKFYYDSPEHLIGTFDFTACMFAWDGVSLYTTREEIRHTKDREVHFHSITYPVASLGRILKYCKNKGYRVPGEERKTFIRMIRDGAFNEEQMALYLD